MLQSLLLKALLAYYTFGVGAIGYVGFSNLFKNYKDCRKDCKKDIEMKPLTIEEDYIII